jgi:vacuolar-type H+-ATPase subunit D/Vma8|tara:strand:+ start:5498 stop:5770 length:273 start_codon:yes stop_codon:yes gene_type:complete
MSNIKNRLRGKITKAELEKIQQQQNKVNSILMELGYLESKKHALLHELADANVVVENTKKELQDKYGHINIDLSTGDWKRNEEDVSNKEN